MSAAAGAPPVGATPSVVALADFGLLQHAFDLAVEERGCLPRRARRPISPYQTGMAKLAKWGKVIRDAKLKCE